VILEWSAVYGTVFAVLAGWMVRRQSDVASASAGTVPARSQWRVVSAIGLAQILAWGGSYYLIAVLARPIVADTGWPFGWVVGGLSLGSLATGLASPRVGRLIDRHGGRPVLAASALLLAAGQVLMAVAPALPVFMAAWVIVGVGMAAGLYDPAFATLGRLYGNEARHPITLTTLFGGFASTVCWPLSAFLVTHAGWRGACLAYAAINLAIVLPLYWFGVPREPAPAPATGPRAPTAAPAPRLRLAFWLLAGNLTLASIVMTVVSVHMLTLLQARGLAMAAAVALGALIGPSQVGARIIEMALARRRHHPVWTLIVSTVLTALGLALMFGGTDLIAAGLVLYGAGAGIRSIARGTVPLALFGRDGYATLIGRLARPLMLAQAASPTLGALLMSATGAGGTLWLLTAGALLNVLTALPLVAFARKS
jgi:predicted MFS family arabinose efflux permease